MAPLYPPGLDENGAVANLYPTSWISTSKKDSRPDTIGITDVYNFLYLAPKSTYAWYNFFPGSEMPGTIFFPGSKIFKEREQKNNLTVQNSCVEYKDKLDPARRVQRGH